MARRHEAVVAMKVIAGKVDIINEIARQANLLALNAAIEAAREQAAGSGQSGKALAPLDTVVQQNASSSEETASEDRHLRFESQRLIKKRPSQYATVSFLGAQGIRLPLANVVFARSRPGRSLAARIPARLSSFRSALAPFEFLSAFIAKGPTQKMHRAFWALK